MAQHKHGRRGKPRADFRPGVCIRAISPGGWGVAGQGRDRIYVWGALPGDAVDVRVVRRQRGRVEGMIDRVIAQQIVRIEPVCGHFDVCGGCLWQHIQYGDQLMLKQQLIAFCFETYDLAIEQIQPVMGCAQIYAYRNKMDFSFGRDEAGLPVLGLYASPAKKSGGGRHGQRGCVPPVFDLDVCALQSEVPNRIVAFVQAHIYDLGLDPYDVIVQTGTLRSLVIREAKSTGQLLVNLVVTEDCAATLKPIAEAIMAAEPTVCGVILSVNNRRSKNAVPASQIVLAGQDTIVEEILGRAVDISPQSFFQVNTAQAERLYDVAIQFAGLTGAEQVWDLYCGTGTLSFLLARHAARVVGVEVVDQAVADAQRNAKNNGVGETQFVCGDVSTVLPDFIAGGGTPDVVTVNPPRAGIYRSVIRRICACNPRAIVYISCNPETLARDLKRFEKDGYRAEAVQPVDLFPHTPHVETVVKLIKHNAQEK